MRPRQTAFVAAGIPAVLLLLSTAAAAARMPLCKPLLAEVKTSAVDEVTEVGVVAGLLNGAIYIRVDEKSPEPGATEQKPNVVLTTKAGDIQLWMEITSFEKPDGVINRAMRTLHARGTGDFASTRIDLALDGTYEFKVGGSYELVGSICPLSGPKR